MSQLRSFLFVLLTCSLIVRVACAEQPPGPPPASDKVVQEKRPEGDFLTVTLPGDVKMLFKKIPAGSFMMGSPDDEKDRDGDEGPVHKVTISKPYYLGVYEVTQAQWTAVMKANPSKYQGRPDNPVEMVSWMDSQVFLERLNALGLGSFRLPTEAQWEYACRAGTKTRFYWGDDPQLSEVGEYAWFNGNSKPETSKVGTKKPNAWGLYDMSGNVYEWCNDRYGEFSSRPQTDPTGASSGWRRPVRGGGWFSTPGCRSAERTNGFSPLDRCYGVGLRLMRSCP